MKIGILGIENSAITSQIINSIVRAGLDVAAIIFDGDKEPQRDTELFRERTNGTIPYIPTKTIFDRPDRIRHSLAAD